MRPITTGGDLTAAAISARRGPTTLSLISPAGGSSASPSSAASSTNTSGPHRSPGQDRWPSSGTPQGLLRVAMYIAGRVLGGGAMRVVRRILRGSGAHGAAGLGIDDRRAGVLGGALPGGAIPRRGWCKFA